MLPISDDAELTSEMMKHNAALAEELEAKETPDGIEPVLSVDDLMKANKKTVKIQEFDDEPDSKIDLYDELDRLDQATPLEDPEEFKDDELEVKVAETLADFRDAIALAEINGVEYIQASRKVIFHFTKPTYPKNHYFFYHGIRVDEVGKTDEIEKFLAMSTEEVNFGKGR